MRDPILVTPLKMVDLDVKMRLHPADRWSHFREGETIIFYHLRILVALKKLSS